MEVRQLGGSTKFGLGEEDLNSFLNLDQTTPQTISGGFPNFNSGIKVKKRDNGSISDGGIIVWDDDYGYSTWTGPSSFEGFMCNTSNGDFVSWGDFWLQYYSTGAVYWGQNGQGGTLLNGGGLTTTGNGQFGGLISTQSDTKNIGQTNNRWRNLYLSQTGTINFGNGDVVLTGSANKLSLTGGVLQVNDKIIFTQIDGYEYIDSLNDGYMDYGATIEHRFNAPIKATGYKSSDGSVGATGSFTTADSKTVTVKNGLITSIV